MKKTRRVLARGVLAGLASVLAPGTVGAAAIDITVVNAGTRSVDGLYLATTAQSAWGPDVLDGDFLAPSGTVTLQGVSCAPPSMVVVAEDVGGCFMYQTVGCGGNATWTITSSTPHDCGR